MRPPDARPAPLAPGAAGGAAGETAGGAGTGGRPGAAPPVLALEGLGWSVGGAVIVDAVDMAVAAMVNRRREERSPSTPL